MSFLRPTLPRLSRKVVHPSQPRRRMGWLVGRRSLVSSSSAMRASSWRARPSARETRSATSQVGLDVPRSRPRIEVASRSAASARASWVSPISSRRRRTARPRATCGVWLMRTPEPSVDEPRHARDYVPGSLSRAMHPRPGFQDQELHPCDLLMALPFTNRQNYSMCCSVRADDTTKVGRKSRSEQDAACADESLRVHTMIGGCR